MDAASTLVSVELDDALQSIARRALGGDDRVEMEHVPGWHTEFLPWGSGLLLSVRS